MSDDILNESPDSESPDVEPTEPLEVKITNNKTKPEWNDEQDDPEYDEITLSDEEKDI